MLLMHPILSFPNHHFPICFPSNILCPCLISLFQYLYIQGGLNMTGTDLCVKSRTAQQVCDLERVKPQPPPSLLLGLEPVQSCLGVARVMSNYGYKKKNQSRSYLNHLVYSYILISIHSVTNPSI